MVLDGLNLSLFLTVLVNVEILVVVADLDGLANIARWSLKQNITHGHGGVMTNLALNPIQEHFVEVARIFNEFELAGLGHKAIQG